MKRKRIIYAASCITLLAALVFWMLPSRDKDVSKVSIGFAGYEIVDGKRNLILVVTNASSYRISVPGDDYEIRGESADNVMDTPIPIRSIRGCGPAGGWGWWQLQLPRIPNIGPGETFRFPVPVPDDPYTWHVMVPFRTIPYTELLPYALQSLWPSSQRDTPISFQVISPAIPPAVPASASL